MIELKQEGRRTYICGDTFKLKDALKAAGCKWDSDRRAWWTGKPEVAEQIMRDTEAGTAAQQEPESPAMIRLVGKARYKGRTYYVRWVGETKRGYSARLVTLDGKLDFWATCDTSGSADGNGDVAAIVKIYEGRLVASGYGRSRMEYMTLADMQQFVAKANRDREAGGKDGECAECGKPMYGRGVLCRDSSGIEAACCQRCAAMPDYERSFC